MKPYYADGQITLYHGDCREIDAWQRGDVLVTDPPYGISYRSGMRRDRLAASIEGDDDTSLRDYVLGLWAPRAALVFGTWRIPRPQGTRARLVWDTKGALGMGDLSIPWKPSDQEIYVLGTGFTGRRSTNVLRHAPVQSTARGGRRHPHEKPVGLLHDLIAKCPPGAIVDPFAGSGSTLVAAKDLGRAAIGVEVHEPYCEIVATRLAQGVLDFGAAS
ncbi:MAG: DNA methyltransferase [Acidimicrobiales bacterium]